MQKNYLLSCFLFWVTSAAFGQMTTDCNPPAPRVAIAGDSWAQYMADDNTHNEVLKIYGQADKIAVSQTFEIGILCTDSSPSSGDYAVSGSEARQWADEVNYPYLQDLVTALDNNPTIDYVLLSIGGNDILAGRSDGGWYQNMDLDVPGSEQALFDQITADIQYILDKIWLSHPDMKIIISGYDYPNFNVSSLWCDFYACGKRKDLSRDEDGDNDITGSEHLITDAELNAMMTQIEALRKDMADNDPRLYFDNGQGLMHYYYGYDDGLYPGITPGTTALPGGQSPYTPGGNPSTPTDLDNFRTVDVCGVGSLRADPIHLDADAYGYKIKNQFDNIFFADFRGTPDATFYSVGAQDGYVDVMDETVEYDGLRMGDDGWFCCSGDATNEFKSILSFNTASLPDNAEVTGASLYLIRSGADDNPFLHDDRNPVLDIKNGHFGPTPGLEWTDGTEAADASDVGCFKGLAEADQYAVRVDLSAAALEHFNKTGITQMRLSFDYRDWSVEYINFYDGNGAAAALSPGAEALQNPPAYEYRIVKTVYDADGTETRVELERGPEIDKREGYVYQEKMRSAIENEEGDLITTFATVAAIEHPGLAKYMADNFAAPANGRAPFLDVQYQLVLPVEIANFTATAQNRDVLLKWKTAAEQNSDYFAVQHSTDGRNWELIAKEPAAGNSTEVSDYQYLHRYPAEGNNYYRLRTNDRDGQAAYSEAAVVYFGGTTGALAVYPNPFTQEFTFKTNFKSETNAVLEVTDILGKEVLQTNLTIAAGTQATRVSEMRKMQAGNYMVRLFAGNKVLVGKLVKR